MKKPIISYLLCGFLTTILLTAAACADSPVDPPEEVNPPQGMPRQFYVVDDPKVAIATPPYDPGVPAGPTLQFSVITPDSTPHRGWWPSRLLVETDRGYSEEILVVPYICLEPSDRGEEFPLNFAWLICDEFAVLNATALTDEQITEVELSVAGRASYVRDFKSRPGGLYIFVVDIGRPAIEEAIRRVQQLDFIDGRIEIPTGEPPCVISDVLPPPPCPPWYLFGSRPFTFSEASGDTIPVSKGGWVRATYTQPDGSDRVTVFRF